MMDLIQIEEEEIKFYVTQDTLINPSSKSQVFYNPLMKINRDFTIYFLHSISSDRKIRILDGMAGSGIRSLRILKELDNIEELWINDLSENAIKIIKLNLDLNKDLVRNKKVVLTQRDFNKLCLEEKFDYIDLDPFGTPVPFIQNALIGLKNKGYIGITATDTSALTGSKPSALLRKYFVTGILTDFSKEFGLRALIKRVIEFGAYLEFAMVPKFSYYYKHHYRVFFQKIRGKSKVKRLLKEIKFISYCEKCLFRNIAENFDPTCPNCGNKLKFLGPIYVGKLWDSEILEKMEKYVKSPLAQKIFNFIKEESKFEKPWYYSLRFFAKKYKIGEIKPIKHYSKLGSRTHFDPMGIKTDLEFQEIIKFLLS